MFFALMSRTTYYFWRWNMTLKEARMKAGLTAKDVGRALGVSFQNVYNWEAGSYLPETGKLLRLAKLYGCTVDELLRADKNGT